MSGRTMLARGFWANDSGNLENFECGGGLGRSEPANWVGAYIPGSQYFAGIWHTTVTRIAVRSPSRGRPYALAQTMAQTLFDKYGGVPAVTVIVRDFYKRVMRRPNLRRYFTDVTLESLIHHQIAFVSMAMGKTPHDYSGRSMKDAHRGVGITAASFDLAAELLADALLGGGVEQSDVDSVLATVKTLRADIVER